MTRRFAVLGLPAPQGSKRHVGEGRMVESSKRVKPWRRQVAAAYRDHDFGDVLDGPVSVTVDFYLPRPKSHYGTGRNAGALVGAAWIKRRGKASYVVMDGETFTHLLREAGY